ncbi:MAG: GNAT family N-acetyltransferase [Actinomycetota bacterium]
MKYGGPELLGPDHGVEEFDCGIPALSEWLRRRAPTNQRSGTSRTWVVVDESNRVAGYYASATASLIRARATGRASRNQPDDIPAVLLARLAVDLRHQGRGLGTALLKHFVLKALDVASLVGVRLLLVHAKDDIAHSFYLKHGFQPSPLDELTLMKLITDI